MTRIVSGTAGGRRLQVPRGHRTRPTADRTREALFSSLQSLVELPGARVLDLYAGSGALGLEALSRGAAAATLVDSDERALAALRANVRALGLPAEVVGLPVERFLSRDPQAYDLVLLDPPYAAEVDPVLAALVPWVAPDGVVVVERSARSPEPGWPDGLGALRSRRYGETLLWYGSRS
ncbi:MAG: 16S rRNA (guanine(966)-N(2))-methyltransferase RsmD [Actinomycetota bacterium]|nr:16S rRNA (guanine(966)-N(2))-methyltransferase RsmD [Actinomycetota bacterium]